MNINTLTDFFMWSTIIHCGILIYSALMIMFARDFIHRLHGKMFSLPAEQINAVLYGFLGIYKMAILVFALVPWIALLIIK